MGAPKIKIYQLPAGYSSSGDSDIGQVVNDELLPVHDKSATPEDALPLTGIVMVPSGVLHPVNLGAGLVETDLTPNSAEFQAPVAGHTDILIAGAESYYQPVVYDSGLEVIPPSGYTLTPSGVQFLSVPYPSGASIAYWRTGSEPGTAFVTEKAPVYDGDNDMFQPRVLESDGDLIPPSGYTLDATKGLIQLLAARSGPVANYSQEKAYTKYFIAEHPNWLPPNSTSLSGGHLYMGPDVFRGTYDYPGDDTEDEFGNPIVQGPIPEFVEAGTYQLDFRMGLVTFPAEFDSEAEPVAANYAYLVGVRNVTSQVLDQVVAASGNYRYKAVSDLWFPGSIGARWIGRNDELTPRNVYVNGQSKPLVVTVTPYDDLTIKTE